MSKQTQGVFLKLTSAIVLDGEVVRAGTLVEVTDAEAKNLLHRGKAVLHEAAEQNGSATNDDAANAAAAQAAAAATAAQRDAADDAAAEPAAKRKGK